MGLLHLGACGNHSGARRFHGRYKQQGQRLWWVIPLPIPPAVPGPAAAGFSSLVWKLSEIYFVTDRWGSGATSAESCCSECCNVCGVLLVCSRGSWPEPRFTLLVSAPKRSKWGFHLSVPPRYFHVPSSSTDFPLRVKTTPEPSLIMAYLVPNGQLCVVYVFFLSTLSTFLSDSSIRCYHVGFFP